MDMMEYTAEVSNIFSTRNLDASKEMTCLRKMIDLGASLTDKEREMMVGLLRKYIKLYANDYINLLLHSFKKADFDKYKTIKIFYVLPIKPIAVFNKTKSSDFISYWFCNDPNVQAFDLFRNKEIHLISEKDIPKKINSSTSKHLILIDDFSGTGNTIRSYLHNLEQNLNIQKNKFSIVLIASMEESYNYLTSNGYTVYCNIIQEKGISSIDNLVIQNEFKTIMQNLEKKFKFRECDKFGYGKSESLISLLRTPNNTFPVFWDGKRNKNAPFERIQ